MGLKERVIGATGAVSGGASIISSWTICHQICTIVIAGLSLIGITVIGMPLAFLSAYTTTFWLVGIAFLALAGTLYIYTPGCMSGKLLVVNTGLLIAGIPFQPFEPYRTFLWLVGGCIVLGTLGYWASQTWQQKGSSSKSGKTFNKEALGQGKKKLDSGSCCQGGHKI